MLAQLAGQVKADGSLDLAAGDGVLLVVVGQAGSLRGDALEDVIHERVHDAHGLAGDAGVGVDLLEDLVDVDGVALLAGLSLLLLLLARGLGGLGGGGLLLALLGGNLARHVESFVEILRKEKQTMRFECENLMLARFYFRGRITLGRIKLVLTNQMTRFRDYPRSRDARTAV